MSYSSTSFDRLLAQGVGKPLQAREREAQVQSAPVASCTEDVIDDLDAVVDALGGAQEVVDEDS